MRSQDSLHGNNLTFSVSSGFIEVMLPVAIRQAASLSDFHALVSAYLELSVRSHRLLGGPL